MTGVAAGLDPRGIKEGIIEASDIIMEHIDSVTKKCETEEQLYNVCKISSNHRKDIASAVKDSILAVGKDGIVNVEDGYFEDIKLELVRGINLNRGYFSYQFVNNKLTGK